MLKPNANTLATWCKELIHWKRPWCWEWWRQEETGTTEDELVGWHHWLNGHEFEQIPRVGDGLGSLACCSPWCCEESGMTEWLNWTELIYKPSNTQGHQKAWEARRGAWNWFSLRAQKEPALLKPWFQTSGLQKYGRINFCGTVWKWKWSHSVDFTHQSSPPGSSLHGILQQEY